MTHDRSVRAGEFVFPSPCAQDNLKDHAHMGDEHNSPRRSRKRDRGGALERRAGKVVEEHSKKKGGFPTSETGTGGLTGTAKGDTSFEVPRTERGAVAKLLAGRDRQEILRRILDGDPLELAQLCMRRLGDRAYLIDGDRLLLRAVARTAHAAPRWHGKPALDDWLLARVDAAMEDLVEEDAGAAYMGMPLDEQADGHYAFIALAFAVDTITALGMIASFNSLPEDARLTWHALAVEGKSLRRYVSEGHGPPEKVRDHMRRAAKALTTPGSLWDVPGTSTLGWTP
jgi:hypothetical protein